MSRTATPETNSATMSPVDEADNSDDEVPHLPSKQSRRCGTCRKEGHNSPDKQEH